MKRFVSLLLVLMTMLPMTVPAVAESEGFVSDTSVMVYEPLNEYHGINDAAWGTAQPAVYAWKHDSWPLLDGVPEAKWISNTEYIAGNVSGNTWRLFRKTVNLCETAHDISGTITANSDNAEEVYVNGVLLGSDGEVRLSGSPSGNVFNWSTFVDYNYQASGNTLVFDFIVRNYPGSDNPEYNPTGLIFSASINYSCTLEVPIDIKPGSFPSCFNNNNSGLIPVAIFGSPSFNVNDVNLATVRLEGLPVAMKPNGRYTAAYQDMNSDGSVDLVVKFIDQEGVFDPSAEYATLTGNLMDGTPFFGVGDICIRGKDQPSPK
jgi:hypothetical protein